nr:glycosyltransferase family 4 protein [Marinococcus luteus]
MKKILILVNHDVVIYNFRLEIVERLLEEGHEVYVSCPYGSKIDKLIDLGCKYIDVEIDRHGMNIVSEIKLLTYYFRLLKEIKPDTVLSFTIKPNIYGGIASRILKIPYIANITGLGTAVEKKGLKQKISMSLYKLAFKRVKRVFFQNTENQQLFIKNNIAVDRHKLIPGSGVNLNRYSILKYPQDEKIQFVFISRIMKEKGVEEYLKAAEFIKNKYPQTNFHVCGFCEENYEDTLNALQDKEIIRYHGMVHNVEEILKESHCTIHPTFYPEGMSNVLLESSACARPIITTDRSGCREIVEDGVTGYIVEQQNVKDLIEKIELFLQLSYASKQQMGLAGRKKVEQEFDREIVVNEYLNVINEE